MAVKIHHGDCLDVLKTMADNSVDAICTDPPYGLSDQPAAAVAECLAAWLKGEVYTPKGKGFMGKKWDAWVPGPEVWRECLRVLKPGGHMLAFAGTRTMDLMCMSIRLAGFELRDSIGHAHDGGGAPLGAWCFGSGFPKSLNVSRAIDKARNEDVEPVRSVCRAIRSAMDQRGLKSRDLTQHFGNCHPRLIDHWAARDTDSQPTLPTWDQWLTLRDVLSIGAEHDAEVWRLNGRKGMPGDAWTEAEVIGHHEGQTPGFGAHRFNVRDTSIRSSSDAARQWQGWGTALKPAWEPIILARKPLGEKNVAANVLKWGTGGLNIDGCRIDAERPAATYSQPVIKGGAYNIQREERRIAEVPENLGRWPANVVHDGSDAVLAAFPIVSSGSANVRRESGADRSGNTSSAFGAESRPAGSPMVSYGDTGSAARFFYCSKTSSAERHEGLKNPGARFANGSTLRDAENLAPAGNSHPTVKPVALITPPGGVVLDAYCGSGSTLKAAELEGFDAIGIEREAEFVAIAKARIASDAPLFADVEVTGDAA